MWLVAGQLLAQPGLKGDYYTGINFERKVFTRVDPQLNFDWRNHNPGPGIPHSYYSIRWTGKLLAPATGEYRFYAKVDDGIRIWVGNKKVMDSWQLNDSQNFSGTVALEAGHYYDLRVDYFNDMLEGEIQLFWQRPDAKKTFLDRFSKPSDPITAQYFSQKPSSVIVPQKPAKPVATTSIASSTPPKRLPRKRPAIVGPQPVLSPPLSKTTASADTVTASVAPIRQPPTEPPIDIKSGATLVLHNVQFEQSSYVLLSESSAELDRVVGAMKANPTWHITIMGHTDNVGDARLNLTLSEHRAKVVAAYLKRHGIADERITATGFGGTRPIAANETEAERRKNRRVEITIN
ncbi:PA14 domain-containing protein [Spirosoma areae]